MYGYIYLTTNLINGKMYIGKHKSSYFNENYKGSGKLLWKAIHKYGWDNFKVELLKECDSEEELNSSEVEEIRLRDAVKSSMYYNLSGGGEGWSSQWSSELFRTMMSDMMTNNNPASRPEVREKMKGPRPSIAGENNPNYGGKSITEDQIIALKEHARSRKGEENPMYGRRGEKSPHYGKVHVNNGEKFITVPVEELSYYESLGFVRTRNKSISGKVYMNNGNNSILISRDEIDTYINAGWSRGRKKLPITRLSNSSTIESISSKKDTTE